MTLESRVLQNTGGSSESRPFGRTWQHKNHWSCQKKEKKKEKLPNISVPVQFTCKTKVRSQLFNCGFFIPFDSICRCSWQSVRTVWLQAESWGMSGEQDTLSVQEVVVARDNGKGGRVKPSVNMAAPRFSERRKESELLLSSSVLLHVIHWRSQECSGSSVCSGNSVR